MNISLPDIKIRCLIFRTYLISPKIYKNHFLQLCSSQFFALSRKVMQFQTRKSINMELVDRVKFIYRIINAAMDLQEVKVQERRAVCTKDGSNF